MLLLLLLRLLLMILRLLLVAVRCHPELRTLLAATVHTITKEDTQRDMETQASGWIYVPLSTTPTARTPYPQGTLLVNPKPHYSLNPTTISHPVEVGCALSPLPASSTSSSTGSGSSSCSCFFSRTNNSNNNSRTGWLHTRNAQV